MNRIGIMPLDSDEFKSLVGLLNNAATTANATVQYSDNSTGIIVDCGGNVIGTGGEDMTLANIKSCLNFIEFMEEQI